MLVSILQATLCPQKHKCVHFFYFTDSYTTLACRMNLETAILRGKYSGHQSQFFYFTDYFFYFTDSYTTLACRMNLETAILRGKYSGRQSQGYESLDHSTGREYRNVNLQNIFCYCSGRREAIGANLRSSMSCESHALFLKRPLYLSNLGRKKAWTDIAFTKYHNIYALNLGRRGGSFSYLC